MSLSITREVLGYAPELKELIKSAEEVENFPTSSKNNTLFSYVKAGYMTKVANLAVDPSDLGRVSKAAKLYGVEKQAEEILGKVSTRYSVKQASENLDLKRDLTIAQDTFESLRCGIVNVDRLTKIARTLYDDHGQDIVLDSIKQYACAGYLEKSAVERALKARYKVTHNEAFEKLASAMDSMNISTFSTEDKRKFADFIHGLDKKACLQEHGFNIYEEIFMTKAAQVACSTIVDLTPMKSVPVESIMRVAPDLVDALGPDVVKQLTGPSPQEVKDVVSSLPLDLKAILAKYV